MAAGVRGVHSVIDRGDISCSRSGTIQSIQTLSVPTLNVLMMPSVACPPMVACSHPAGTVYSVAAEAEDNHVYVPLAANNVFPGCLKGWRCTGGWTPTKTKCELGVIR